jgi:large subunit ribosomal protein L37Ae
MATKKGMTSGRFGVRYGTRVRKRISEIEAVQKLKHECPVCHYVKVRRVSMGIWSCKHCGAKFAGGAWQPKTDAAAIHVGRQTSGAKQFETSAEEFNEPVRKEK